MTLPPDAAIPDALLSHVQAFLDGYSNSLGVAWPDKAFAPADDVPYLEVTHLPNRTENLFVGDEASSQHQGLLQVAVMYPAGSASLIAATELAGLLVGHFRKGARLTSNGVVVRIERKGWIAPPLEEPSRLRVPVTIPYVCFAS